MKQKLKKILVFMLVLCISISGIGICAYGEGEIGTETEVVEEELLDEEIFGPAEEKTDLPEDAPVVDEEATDSEAAKDDSQAALPVPETPAVEEKEEETVAEIKYTTADYKKLNLLSSLSVIGVAPDPDALITRREFTQYITKIMNIDAASVNTDVTYFTDVGLSNPYLSSINYVYTAGIMNGVYDKQFCPKDYISYNNAVVSLVRMLGYELVAQKNGGYPSGYLNVASQLDLYSTGANEEGLLTGKALMGLLYKALLANVLEIDSVSNDEANYKKSTANFMEKSFGFVKCRGQIVADGFASVGGRSVCGTNQVVIKYAGRDYVYTLLNANESVYVGMNVDFYTNSEGEIVHMEPVGNQEELVIDAYDIRGVDPYIRSVTYRQNNKNKTAQIEAIADFIYNGVNYIPTADEVENINGSMTLLDSDGDGGYDCVFITDYQYYFAKGVTADGILNDIRFATYFDFHADDKDYFTRIMKYGVEIPVGMINESEIVAVAQSPNTDGMKKIVAHVYDNLIQGKVTTIGSDTLWVDGKEYEYIKGFASSTIYLGDKGVFGLDENGRICFVHKSYENVRTYLYVTGFATMSVLDKKCQIRAMNEEGDFVIYDFADTYKVNDEKGTAELVEEYITLGGDSVVKQLVAVEFDENSKIKKIEFDTTPDGPRPFGGDDVFTYNKSFTGRLDANRNVIAAEYWMLASTHKFTVFTDNRGNVVEDASSAATKNFKVTKSRVMIPMEVYDASEVDRVAGAIVFVMSIDDLETYYGYDTNSFIVEEIIHQRNADGNFVPAASGWMSGARVTLMGEQDVFEISGWQPGDVYSVMRNSAGNVIKATKKFALAEEESTSAMYYDKVYTADSPAVSSEKVATNSALNFGTLRNLVSTPIRAAYIETEGSGEVFTYSFTSSSRIYTYDLETNECKATSFDDVVPGKGKVFTISGYGQIYDMIIFE